MNVLTSLLSTSLLTTSPFSTEVPRPQNQGAVVAAAARPVRRERGIGTGYGSSSGYAAAAPYASSRTPGYFRFN